MQFLTDYGLLELIRRLRSLTLVLLPVEVSPSSINDPTSRVITPQVISAYRAAAGDFQDAVSSAECFGCRPQSAHNIILVALLSSACQSRIFMGCQS